MQIHHHHYHKELTVAIVLASVAVIAIISSTFCAWFFWRRSRQMLDSKDIESSGLFSDILSIYETVETVLFGCVLHS